VFANHENRYLIIKEPVIEGAKEKYDAIGKFLDVILLVIVLMVAREVFQRIYVSLGSRKS
jgi:hypothetical protein